MGGGPVDEGEEMNRLLLGDALDHLKTLASNSIDVAVTSPPYNLGGDFHTWSNGHRLSYGGYGDDEDDLPEPEYQARQISVLAELHRVIKPGGWLFYSHKNRIKDGRIISPINWIEKTDWAIYQDIVINMIGTANTDKRRFFPVHEFVFVLSASKGNRLNNDNCLTSIWKFPQVNRKDVGHPATFHPHLPRICLEASAKAGDWVIDPYMGSGTTGIVAAKLGMNFTGIERNPAYFENACKSINGMVLPPVQTVMSL